MKARVHGALFVRSYAVRTHLTAARHTAHLTSSSSSCSTVHVLASRTSHAFHSRSLFSHAHTKNLVSIIAPKRKKKPDQTSRYTHQNHRRFFVCVFIRLSHRGFSCLFVRSLSLLCICIVCLLLLCRRVVVCKFVVNSIKSIDLPPALACHARETFGKVFSELANSIAMCRRGPQLFWSSLIAFFVIECLYDEATLV